MPTHHAIGELRVEGLSFSRHRTSGYGVPTMRPPSYGPAVNDEHVKLCSSDYWRELLRDEILPYALAGARLADDILEVGPGPGLTTDLLRPSVKRLTALELDPDLASALAGRMAGTNVDVVHGDATDMPFEDGRFTGAVSFSMLHHVPSVELQDRFLREVARVLRTHSQFVACDSLATDELAAFHCDDVYNPVDPTGLANRLVAAGFDDIDLRANDFGWAVRATAG